MISIMVGLAAIFGGLWGMAHWSYDFMAFLRGVLPISVFCGGCVAVIAGVVSRREGKGSPTDVKKEKE